MLNKVFEHPFHIEDWDGKVETMVADLNGSTKVDPARVFPTDGTTPFGEWVKAGALKAGDQVSTLGSVADTKPANNSFGPRVAANDNSSLTIMNIARDSAATRVYNFEVESLAGEFTHNYFVGDDAAWAHNGRGSAWKAIFLNPNTPSYIRGWIQQELNSGRRFWNVRTPPGCDFGHHPSQPASEGYPHGPNSRIEWIADNRGRGGRSRR